MRRIVVLFFLASVSLSPLFASSLSSPGVYCKLSNNNPWLRQQVILLCEFYTERSFMEIEHNSLDVPWALSYKIPLKQTGVRRNGKQYYFHRFGWVLIPLKAGAYKLGIPKLKLNFGQYKVALPLYKFHVKSLPTYLNPDSLVGRLEMRLLSQSKYWLQHQHLYRFRFMVTARGIPARWLPSVEVWLKSKSYARYYVQRVKTRVTIDKSGLVTRLLVDAALIPVKIGKYNLIQTQLKYFDPLSSQWNNQSVSGGRWVSLPAWIYWIFYISIVLVVFYILWVAGRYLFGFLDLWIRQSRIKKRIKRLVEYSDLRKSLHEVLDNYGINSKLPENAIYDSWLKLYSPNRALRDNLDMSSQQEFSSKNLKPVINLDEYRSKLLVLVSVYSVLVCYHKTR